SLPNGVEVTGVSSVPIGFDVVHAAYDAASAMANLREDHILNFYRPTLERSGGHGGQMLAIDAGEDPWMSAVLIMAGIINGENNRSMLGEHLLEEFSEVFSMLLASNVAEASRVECEIICGVGDAVVTWIFEQLFDRYEDVVSVPVRDSTRDELNQMRLQFQQGSSNITSLVFSNLSSVGVAKAQVFQGLSLLFKNVNNYNRRLGGSAEFSAAIVGMSEKVNISAPVSPIGNVYRNSFVYDGLVYRVDLENLRGTNLRQ
ncbi:MAG: hypothetical protein Q8L60_09520, partial [Gammaproteobacteria bacterium]|nr:hypothetical protein [Gammaproteobacteria bacterium]